MDKVSSCSSMGLFLPPFPYFFYAINCKGCWVVERKYERKRNVMNDVIECYWLGPTQWMMGNQEATGCVYLAPAC